MTRYNPQTTTLLPTKFTWDSIYGWCDFTDIYCEQITRIGNKNAIFVEVGSFFGKSTAFMANELKRRGKPNIEFYAVDTWKGSQNEAHHIEVMKMYGGDIFEAWQANMARCGVQDWVKPIRKLSVEAAKDFVDGTIDFVFLDADHDTEPLVTDIRAWLPKLKNDGVIAGHDINTFGTVRTAVEKEFFGKWRMQGQSWLVDGK